MLPRLHTNFLTALAFVISTIVLSTFAGGAAAQSTAFKQAVATAAASDPAIAAFYQDRAFKPIWTGRGNKDKQRRAALLQAVGKAGMHGLPSGRYDPAQIKARMAAAKTPEERGALEVYLSATFLQYARDVQTGVLTPSKVSSEIVRQVPLRDRQKTLVAFSKSSASGFMKVLPPKSAEYTRLMKEKLRLEKLLGKGGWGQKVPVNSLKPGASGNAVVILRNRLIAMGYLQRTTTQAYDASIQAAVQQFQLAHGLATDGVAGPGTMKEINKDVDTRLTQVIVAMERERWINRPLGDRHVWVNLTDFSAQIRDKGQVTFQTRSVIGATDADRRSPEFSDVMEFMVINPSWYVPRSIATKEYLPLLRNNPNAVSHLEITDSRGRKVNRGAVNFAQYTASTFPFNMRQPPSRGNALGLVKFMFPNKYNIYLHDTPAKNLFSREVRAFSHGCIRLNDPFDFAYALLAKQTSDPEGFFQSKLRTGAEARVNLNEPVQVHLVYRTAFTSPAGNMHYRRDVYGRDGRIWSALQREGVALRAVAG
ncbi:MAG: L,D-transpeptidase family protein [Pseudomonadota bacterium]